VSSHPHRSRGGSNSKKQQLTAQAEEVQEERVRPPSKEYRFIHELMLRPEIRPLLSEKGDTKEGTKGEVPKPWFQVSHILLIIECCVT